MADQTSDDVYDDPDNILADTDDTVDGATELPDDEKDDPSQSIFVPELSDDDRGSIPALDGSDDDDDDDDIGQNHPEDINTDSSHLGGVDTPEERDD